MKIKVLNPVLIKGEQSGLYNYQYITSDGTPVGAIFQGTADFLAGMSKYTD